MKKITALILAVSMLMTAFGLFALADDSATVYVTISDGSVVLACQPVELSDVDGDQALTIYDALYLAHEGAFEGGAETGFAAYNSDWGLSLGKLWGIENGGSYGYYVNNASAYSLVDPLSDGDILYAFVYTDLIAWSDAYSFFDQATVNANAGDEITLTLSMVSFDENWMPVDMPVEGAKIVIDGEVTDFVTDAEGKVTFTLTDDAQLISAVSDVFTLVPPVCVIEAD